jgi:hypothetical protein
MRHAAVLDVKTARKASWKNVEALKREVGEDYPGSVGAVRCNTAATVQ